MTEPFSFEGDEVTDFTAQLPSASLEAPQAFPRGTILNLNIQVRVKSVRLEEDRKGNLSRKHILALEDVSIVDFLTPETRKALIEAAEAQAVAENDTIPEEEHIEDVLPEEVAVVDEPDAGDLTVVSADDDELADDDFDMEDFGRDVEYGLDDDLDDKSSSDTQSDEEVDDDDHEHDWMDDDEVEVGGVRVTYRF